MRADRLLSILLLLQARGRMSAGSLADRLEVSRRTIYRDLEALSTAGVPVVVGPGPRGGASLMPGYRTDLTGLTAAEVETLLGLASTSVARHLGLRSALESASRKLAASSSGGAGLRIQERVLVDAERWWDGTAAPPHLGRIQDAVFTDHRLLLRYRSGEQRVVEREVEPYGLVLKAGVWYLLAGRGGERRTYRISRVEGAEILDASFERPAGFDLEAAWGEAVRGFRDRGSPLTVRVRPRPGASGLFWRMAGEHLRGRAADGGSILVFPALGHAAAFLAGFVSEVEVLEPRTLRARLAEIGRGLAATYADPGE